MELGLAGSKAQRHALGPLDVNLRPKALKRRQQREASLRFVESPCALERVLKWQAGGPNHVRCQASLRLEIAFGLDGLTAHSPEQGGRATAHGHVRPSFPQGAHAEGH